MNTPRFPERMHAMLVLLIGYLMMPALSVMRVDARGLGHEHLQIWRMRCSGLKAAVDAALHRLERAGHAFLRWQRQPWFAPAVALAAVLVLVVLDRRALFAAPLILGTTLTEGVHPGEAIAWEATTLKRESVTVLSGQNLLANAVVGRVNKGVGRVSTPTVGGTATGNGTVSQVFAGPEVQLGNYVLTLKTVVANGGVWGLVNPTGKALPDLTMTPGAGGSTTYTSREINFTITDGSTDFAAGDTFTFVVSTTAPAVIGTGNGTVSALSLGADAKPGNYRVECIAAITNSGTFKIVGPSGETVAVGTIVAGAGGTLVLANQRQLNITITDGSTDFAVGDAFNVAVFNQLLGGKVVAWDPTTFDGRDDVAGVLVYAVNASSADAPGVLVVRDAVLMKSALQWGAAITDAQKESAYLDLAARGVLSRDSVV